jgi:dTDP-glucose 4,6-dehydratase
VSTSEVYGTAQYVPIDENHPKVAQSPYSASKIAADALVESFNRSFGLETTIVRPFNTYGPRQSERAVIPTIIAQMLAGGEVRLGNVSPTRDFTFVTDTVAGMIAALKPEVAPGSTINLGSGSELSVRELLDMISRILGIEYSLVSDPKRMRPEKSEVDRLVSNNSLAAAVLGWRPQVALEEGLVITCEWFKENLTSQHTGKYIT